MHNASPDGTVFAVCWYMHSNARIDGRLPVRTVHLWKLILIQRIPPRRPLFGQDSHIRATQPSSSLLVYALPRFRERAGVSSQAIPKPIVHRRFSTEKWVPCRISLYTLPSLSRFCSGESRSITGSRYRYGGDIMGSTHCPLEGLFSGGNTGNGNRDGEMAYAGRSCTYPFIPSQPWTR
jgi:hypothetical protein